MHTYQILYHVVEQLRQIPQVTDLNTVDELIKSVPEELIEDVLIIAAKLGDTATVKYLVEDQEVIADVRNGRSIWSR